MDNFRAASCVRSVINDGFREEFLKSAAYEKYGKRKSNMQPPFSEYVISPVTLWDWNFTLILRFNDGLITQARLLWMDSDLANRESWEEIVKADLAGDFKKLFDFLSTKIPEQTAHFSNNSAVWTYPWGSIAIWAEDRSFTEGIMISWLPKA